MAAHGIATHTADLLLDGTIAPAQLNLYATMGLRSHYRTLSKRTDTILSAFFVNESPNIEPRLFADLDDVSRYFRRLYSYAPDAAMETYLRRPLAFRPSRFPYPFDEVDEQAWSNRDRSFLTLINTNKLPRVELEDLYAERLRATEYFGRYGEIDLYGKGWAGPPFRVGETRAPRPMRNLAFRAERRWGGWRHDPLLEAARRVYRGPVEASVDTFARYTFSISFENMVLEGWVTEKIFNSLRAGTIPVYLGAPDVERWVWPECFVDMRRFAGYDELRAYLHQLSPAEIDAYREAGREYFASAAFRPFSKRTFAETFEEIVHEDAGITL